VRADVLRDDVFVDTTMGHFNDRVNGNGTGRDRASKAGFDFSAVAGFDLIDLVADDAAGHRTG
jgi:hypothetical protein